MTEKETFKEFLKSKPVAFYPDFSAVGGSTNAGVLLSQLFYWKDKESDPDGWIYKTQKDWKSEISLTRTEQETARKKLRDAGILQEKLKGNPAKLYYRIEFDKLIECLSTLYESRIKDAETLHAETTHPKVGETLHASMREGSTLSLAESTPENTDKFAMLPKIKESRRRVVNRKPKGILSIPEIEPLIKIIVFNGMKESAISSNLKMLMLNAVELHGIEFCELALRGRYVQAARQQRPAALGRFFDPENGEWMTDCSKLATAPTVQAGGVVEPHMIELMAEFEKAQCL